MISLYFVLSSTQDTPHLVFFLLRSNEVHVVQEVFDVTRRPGSTRSTSAFRAMKCRLWAERSPKDFSSGKAVFVSLPRFQSVRERMASTSPLNIRKLSSFLIAAASPFAS